ncbi:FGGY family carbohydrate kinase, partial [Klebsiella pneumoniae]|uniref:FGGY family carbohydrate kinase n=1 Tax=Klebsiella pneumoniae TaxID=573 RepID=UPI0020342378
MDFYLGIDIGTSRVKAVLFDQHFTACASAAENTSPRLSANGYAEQDMTQLWHSVLAILRQIARHPALQAGRLRAIGPVSFSPLPAPETAAQLLCRLF